MLAKQLGRNWPLTIIKFINLPVGERYKIYWYRNPIYLNRLLTEVNKK